MDDLATERKVCEPILQEDGLWKCRVCGFTFPGPFSRFCGSATVNLEAQQMPSLPRQAWNLATSLKDFVSDGCKLVSKEEYEERLNVCHVCEYRKDTRCLLCGCKLALKARGRAFKCPDKRWREL